jgi:CRP/FNR family cyclic AMP-dependent transcriptional regulator
MSSPNALGTIEARKNYAFATEQTFYGLSPITLQAFERIKVESTYPKDAVLFMQGEPPRRVFVLCDGQVKLSLCNGAGKTFIVRVAHPGELLGLSALISGTRYELTAETLETCRMNLVQREEFLRFLTNHSDACFRMAEQLSFKYSHACHELRALGLSSSVGQRLAKLLLQWSQWNGQPVKANPYVKLPYTQDEIAQMIGCCRETVTRLFIDLKRRQIADCRGSTLLIHDMSALQGLADNTIPQLRRGAAEPFHRC